MRPLACLLAAALAPIAAGPDPKAAFLADYTGPAERLRTDFGNCTAKVTATAFHDGRPVQVQTQTIKMTGLAVVIEGGAMASAQTGSGPSTGPGFGGETLAIVST